MSWLWVGPPVVVVAAAVAVRRWARHLGHQREAVDERAEGLAGHRAARPLVDVQIDATASRLQTPPR